MEIGFLHLHVTVAIIFLVLLLSKVILLLAGKKETLQKVRDKTRVLEMALGGLIILTGGYMFFLKSNPELYLYAKALLILAAIPLGIIGFKKMKPMPAILALLVVVYIYGVAESKSLSFSPKKFDVTEAMESNKNLSEGEVIYTSLCTDCHGVDGKKQLYKAPDLTQSKLSRDQKIEIISDGKGIMQGYSRSLTSEEISAVLNYIDGL